MHEREIQLPERWLTEVLIALQKAGFVTCEADNLAAAVETIQETIYIYRDNYHKSFYTPESYVGDWTAEQEIAALDKSRVWIIDTEADFEAEDYWYIRTLLDWAGISRSRFNPQNLTEIWLVDPNIKFPHIDQPIEVSFKSNGQAFVFHTDRRGGWFDYDLIRLVNTVIESTGSQFASILSEKATQSAYICCLTVKELKFLKHERGWRFHEHLFSKNIVTT